MLEIKLTNKNVLKLAELNHAIIISSFSYTGDVKMSFYSINNKDALVKCILYCNFENIWYLEKRR